MLSVRHLANSTDVDERNLLAVSQCQVSSTEVKLSNTCMHKAASEMFQWLLYICSWQFSSSNGPRLSQSINSCFLSDVCRHFTRNRKEIVTASKKFEMEWRGWIKMRLRETCTKGTSSHKGILFNTHVNNPLDRVFAVSWSVLFITIMTNFL